LVRGARYRQKGNKGQAPFRLKAMSDERQFVICIQNEGYPASLELWKVYRALPDKKAAEHQLIRVIDESGEDYLYSETYFVPIKLPQAVEEALLNAS
jgi:hypothetical protein